MLSSEFGSIGISSLGLKTHFATTRMYALQLVRIQNVLHHDVVPYMQIKNVHLLSKLDVLYL